MLSSWEERPIEVANLLNPAFCALLLRDATADYQGRTLEGLPFPLAFLVLPIVLHKPTRDALPSTTNSLFHSWLQDNTLLQLEVSRLVLRLRPYSREAILFGLQHNMLRISDDGNLLSATDRIRNPFPNESEPAECRARAAFIGRWFRKSGNITQLLAMWGLRP